MQRFSDLHEHVRNESRDTYVSQCYLVKSVKFKMTDRVRLPLSKNSTSTLSVIQRQQRGHGRIVSPSGY